MLQPLHLQMWLLAMPSLVSVPASILRTTCSISLKVCVRCYANCVSCQTSINSSNQPTTSSSYSTVYNTGVANNFWLLTSCATIPPSLPSELHCIAPSGALFWTAKHVSEYLVAVFFIPYDCMMSQFHKQYYMVGLSGCFSKYCSFDYLNSNYACFLMMDIYSVFLGKYCTL